MNLKDKILALIQDVYIDVKQFIASLSPEERAQEGSWENWSFKDSLAHIAAWNSIIAQRLAHPEDDKLPPIYGEEENTNQAIYEQHKDITWEKLQELLEDIQRDLIAAVEALDQETLVSKELYAWQQERPLWRPIVGTAHEHAILHLAELYTKRGDAKGALRLMEESTYRFVPLVEDEPEIRGAALYNLGCYYALAGEKEKAIIQVKAGLQVRPDLLEWSKQDTDLDSLRHEPAFQAIYADE